MSLRCILPKKKSSFEKLNRYYDCFPAGGVEAGCLRRLSSLQQVTRNRLKPVQTGRFHLGLVFSRWRRGKFGLELRPKGVLIGQGLDGDFLAGVRLAPVDVSLFQFAQAPTRLLRPWRKRGQTPMQNGFVR